MQAKLNSAESGGMRIITGLMFRLLPIQILLATTAQINGLVSGYFASNYIGINAMSAVGLYGPVNMLINALSVMLVGGNIKGRTRTMTTAISLLKSQGIFTEGIALGMILLIMAFIVQWMGDYLRREEDGHENY
jgi:ABC-type tungstate transport system substrate-binding protein